MACNGVRQLDALYQTVTAGPGRRLQGTRVGRVLTAARRRLSVQIDPHAVFASHTNRGAVPLEALFFMVTHDAPEISVTAVTPADIAIRIAACGTPPSRG
jgi:hypothetical protein